MHPYKTAPARAFWSKAVQLDLDPIALLPDGDPLIRPGERVMSAGSCFAANLVPSLEEAGLLYLRTENTHPILAHAPPENLSYGRFSAGYGNIYTTRQLLQLLQRCLGEFKPDQDRLHLDGRVVDVFRPGLRYAAASDAEFDRLQAQHLRATLAAFQTCDVFVFTLGLTEAWASRTDGAVYPACPGTIAGEFDPAQHAFFNFTASEIADDFNAFLTRLRRLNPGVRVVLTVSPVPLVATATGQHVLLATISSKSALRVAAEAITSANDRVTYFPAYEIILGPQAPADYLEGDRRTPSRRGIAAVMRAFLHACGIPQPGRDAAPAVPAPEDRPEPAAPDPPRTGMRQGPGGAESPLGGLIVGIECEEAMADR